MDERRIELIKLLQKLNEDEKEKLIDFLQNECKKSE